MIRWWLVLAIAGVLTGQHLAMAQGDNAAAPGAAARGQPAGDAATGRPTGVIDLIVASGVIGLLIILLSVAGFALFIEHAMTIRRANLAPPGLAHTLHDTVTAGNYKDAQQLCKRFPSYLAYVVMAGLQEVGFNYDVVEKAMEEASQEQAARLYRKIEYMALIGSVAPMLGLLGTVYGLVLAFKKVAESQGLATAADLADGIYLALITTVEGLVVAIPAIAAYAIFRSRIEQLTAEVNLIAEQIFVNYKRTRGDRRGE